MLLARWVPLLVAVTLPLLGCSWNRSVPREEPVPRHEWSPWRPDVDKPENADDPAALLPAPEVGPPGELPSLENAFQLVRGPEAPGAPGEAQVFAVDLKRLNAAWSGPWIRTVEDAFQVEVETSVGHVLAPTHLFGERLVVLPYHDEDGRLDAAGEPVARGDAILAEVFRPGDIGIALRHRRVQRRRLGASLSPPLAQSALQLEDGHLQVVLGVERDGAPGVITMSSPQNYEGGRFGDADYPLIFFRVRLPDYLSEDQNAAFVRNVRTMLVGLNAVTRFSVNFGSGDRLSAVSPTEAIHFAALMVRAVTGDEAARAELMERRNHVYCSELAYLALSAGLHAPLNAKTFVPLVGEDTWRAFESEVLAQRAGERGALARNRNPLVGLVDVGLAPEDLDPVALYAPPQQRQSVLQRMAVPPLGLADLVDLAVRALVPREIEGEALGALQAELLQMVGPALLDFAARDSQWPDAARREADALFARIVDLVAAEHGDYDAFRKRLEPLLREARAQLDDHAASAEVRHVPPATFHFMALGLLEGGLIHVEYAGHGIHYSLVRQPPPSEAPHSKGVLSWQPSTASRATASSR